MTTCIHTFFEAWGAQTPDLRAEKTDAAIGSNFYYSDPNAPTPLQGRDAYLEYIAQFTAMMPGGTARVLAVSEHHGHLRATVEFAKDGQPIMLGQYFADLTDGKLSRVIGFQAWESPIDRPRH